MRLNTINSGIDHNFGSSLRILLKGSVPATISEQVAVKVQHGKLADRPSLQYLFVEAAINSGLMSEADMSGLQTMLQAGIAKLKAALTPSTSTDLDVLMAFMAPGTGGSQAVNDLLAAAKSSSQPISQNEDWWNNFFSTLNINDPTVQKDLQYQVADEVGQEMLRDPGLPGPGGATPQPGSGPQQATAEPLNQQSYTDELNQEMQNAQQWRQQLTDLVSRRRADQQTASSKIDQINSRLDQLMRNAPRTEDFMGPIGNMLLEFDSVRNNANRITRTTIKTINHLYDTDIPAINEAGLFDNLRTMMANPRYAKRQAQSSADTSKNLQAAKLAVKIATDHLREQFNAKLQDAGLLPQDIMKTYAQWAKLRSAGGNPNEVRRLEEKLKQAFSLFDTKPSGESGEVGPQDTTGGGASAADVGSDPLNADQQPGMQQRLGGPEAALTSDLTGFQRTVAERLMKAAMETARAGGNYEQVLQAAKRVAKLAYKVNPELTQQIWNYFVYWLREQAGRR